MKTTKLIAIALILGIASLGYAQSEGPADQAPNQSTQSILIPLKKAMQSPDLVRAMHAQVDRTMFQQDKPSYTVPVRIKHTVVYVNGTYQEWDNFLRADLTDNANVAKRNLIPLGKAIRDANLVKAMRAQLSPTLISGDKPVYIAPVRYKHSIVYISGTYDQWKAFFSIKPKALPSH